MTLRIQRSAEREVVLLRLSGRIQGDQLPALRTLLGSEAPDQNFILDLKEVNLVDREAVRFLAQSESQGVTLRNCSAFIREWILQDRIAMRRGNAEPPEDQQEQGERHVDR